MMKKSITLAIAIVLLATSGLTSQTLVWAQKAHPDGLQVNGAIFSSDGASVLSGTNCHPAKIRRFNVTDGSMTWDYTVGASLECMMGVALSSNSQYFATAEETGHLMLFDYTQNPPTLAQTINLGTSYAFSVDFAPDASRVITGCSSGKLKAFQLPGGAEAWSITAHTGWVTAVDYASDNSKIATGGSDNKVKIWDANGTLLLTLNGHLDDITGVKFTPDNQRLLSIGVDKKMRVWDTNTGALLQTVTVSTQGVNGLSISPDGQYAVTAADTTLKIWRLSDYSPAGEISTGAWSNAIAVSWSPIADYIVCGTANGTLLLFDVSATLAAKDVQSFSAKIYPNPGADIVNIEWPENESVMRIDWLDVHGRLLFSINYLSDSNSQQIDLGSQTTPGAYIIRLISADGDSFTELIYHH